MSDSRKQATANVFDRAAGTYDQLGVDFFTPMGHDLVARAGVRAGERVLDLGAGRGAVTFAAADAVGAEGDVHAIDIAPTMVELLRADAQERGLANVRVSIGDAEAPDVEAASVDAILAGLALFFLADPASALRRYGALLRPGGRLGFTTFADNDPHFEAAMKEIGRYLPDAMPPRDERQGPFGTPEAIDALLADAGFVVTHSEVIAYESRFSSTDHWLAWAWSHGGRYVLERVPAADLPQATEAARAAFEEARTADGDYAITTLIRFTLARADQPG